jgi:integrase
MSSIFKNGNLYWRQVYRNGKPLSHSLKTSDRQEAKFICAKLDAEEYTPGKEIPCSTAIDQYIETMRPRCSAEYVATAKRRLKSICEGTHSLRQLTEHTIQTHVQRCKSKYDSNYSIACVKAFCKWAVRSGYIPKSPAEWIKKIPIQERTRESFTPEQVRAIIKAAEPETIYPLVMLAIYTGMRKGELLRLVWEDIDLKAGVITVKVSKAKKVRRIPISEALAPVLRHYYGKTGHICDLHNHRRILARIMRNAKVEGGWHHFRHTFCTLSLRSGVDVQTVCDIAGHSSISVTAKYLTSTPDHHAQAVNRLKF